MADVFLSYKRDDRSAVELVAAQLRAVGLSVWFDASMNAGEAFHIEIDREARSAKAILVCWSPAARNSAWVNAEAMIGFEERKLAACYIAGPDSFQAPAPFNTTHSPDLRSWVSKPSQSQDDWKSVLRRVGVLCQRQDLEDWGNLDSDASSRELMVWLDEHQHSPLFLSVHAALVAREAADKAHEAHEQELREAYAREASERQARKAAEHQLAREEQEQTRLAAEAEERRTKGPLPTFIGSVLAVPILIVVYAVVSTLAYIGMILFQMLDLDPRGGGLTYGAELFASCFSAYFGIKGARAAIDACLKAWNGWAAFIAFAATWLSMFYLTFVHLGVEVGWWSIALAVLQALISTIAAFFAVAKKEDIG